MTSSPMHEDEFPVDQALAAMLLADQFPDFALLPLRAIDSGGTVNAIFRLGSDLAVRIPKIEYSPASAEKEAYWLPKLAPLLPTEVPLTVAVGKPGLNYPWPWSICQWLPGQTPAIGAPVSQAFARDLGRFVASLQSIDPTGGPAPEEHNGWRGEPLSEEDDGTREALANCDGLIDVGATAKAWERALNAPTYEGAPRWLHGDLTTGNLLGREGRLTGVIDWGCLGVGDPACDLMLAWLVLPATARGAFRAEVDADAHTWQRARGWALRVAIQALPYYLDTNEFMVGMARFAIAEVLADPAE